MWGTGRTPAGLHVHTTGLGSIARWSEKSPGGVLVAGSIHLPPRIPYLAKELREPNTSSCLSGASWNPSKGFSVVCLWGRGPTAHASNSEVGSVLT